MRDSTRRRARCEDRIRNAKDMGLMKFPLQGFAQNQVWCQIVQLAGVIVAWMQAIALAGHDARRWEPKRFRARLIRDPRDHRAPLSAQDPAFEAHRI